MKNRKITEVGARRRRMEGVKGAKGEGEAGGKKLGGGFRT
jgi:hypothetical protein